MLKEVILTRRSIEILNTNHLIRFEGCQAYVKVYKENGSSMVSTEKLQDVVIKMKSIFYQCHKSHVINLEKVVSYNKNGFILLSNGDKVPVARRRKSAFEGELKKWLERAVDDTIQNY
jgi:two-component system, LytTR family, response regulator